METRIKEYAASWKGCKRDNINSISLIRYADDFVIIHESLEIIKQSQEIIQEWLAQYNLEFKPEKTRMVHTLEELNDTKPGFNFLGFNIRQFPVGKYQTGKNTNGRKLGFKTIIKPSEESLKSHYDNIANTCKEYRASSQKTLIVKLNPIIRGWCNYFKTVAAKSSFSKMGRLTYLRLARWTYRRHPNKGKRWIVKKYWTSEGKDNWVFGDKKGCTLIKHTKTAINYHTKVKGEKSPYDGDTLYWAKRMGEHPELKTQTARLLKKQNGKCNWCNLSFQEDDTIENDHITPTRLGGTNSIDNRQLLHKHCHDIKTKDDLKSIKAHKRKKENQKLTKWFNQLNWVWSDDIPTLVNGEVLIKEPKNRAAVCGESCKHGSEDESLR